MYKTGFTLIEIMIVLLIIGVMSAVATISINAPSYSRFLASAEKLSTTFSILSDQAIYTSSVISCDLDAHHISCRSYRDGDWSELDLKQLVSWQWPEDLTVKQILVNGTALKDKQEIKFLPSGDNDALSVEVSNSEFTSWIDGDLTGKYKVAN